jgi:hypothetical protein
MASKLRDKLNYLNRAKIIVDDFRILGTIDDYLYFVIYYNLDSLEVYWYKLAGKIDDLRLYDYLTEKCENRINDIFLNHYRIKLLLILSIITIKENRLTFNNE